MRNSWRILRILPVVALVLIPLVFAGPTDAIANVFQLFFSWMQITAVMFGITFMFLMVMFYGIFAAGLTRVTVFQEGSNISRPGKMVALSLSVLSTVGILFILGNSPGESMRHVLNAMGWFAAVAFSLLIFGISYLNFKQDKKTWPLVFLTTGLGMVVFGLLVDTASWFSFGWTFIIIGVIWFLFDRHTTKNAAPVPQGEQEVQEQEGSSRNSHEGMPGTVAPDSQTGTISGRVIDEVGTRNNGVDSNMPGDELADPSTNGVVPFRGDGLVKVIKIHNDNVIASARIDSHGRFTITDVPRQIQLIVYVDNTAGSPSKWVHYGSQYSRPGEAHEDPRYLDLVAHATEENVIIVANRSTKKRAARAPEPMLAQVTPSSQGYPFKPENVQLADEEIDDHIATSFPLYSSKSLDPNKEYYPDLSKLFLQVENQVNTHACAAFAAASIWEYYNNLQRAKQDYVSRLSKFCLYYYCQTGERSMKTNISRGKAVKILKDEGCTLQSTWEDKAENVVSMPIGTPNDDIRQDMGKHKINGLYRLEEHNYIVIISALQEGIPVLYGMMVDPDMIDLTDKNPLNAYDNPHVSDQAGPHAFVIVGYNPKIQLADGTSKPAFRIRNSWGLGWGNNGHLWVTVETLLARSAEGVYHGDPPIIITKNITNRSAGPAVGDGLVAPHVSDKDKKHIIKILGALKANELPPNESLKWRDRMKESQVRAILKNLILLRPFDDRLGPMGEQAKNEGEILITYMQDVVDKYKRKDVKDLAHVRDEDVNTLIEDLLQLFRDSHILPYIRTGDWGLRAGDKSIRLKTRQAPEEED